MSAAEVESARLQWEDGYRRIQAEQGKHPRYDRLMEQVEVVTAELRRRIGQTFTLAQLVNAYAGAEDWSRQVVEDEAGYPGWARDLATVLDAAFHLFSRGAQDYEP